MTVMSTDPTMFTEGLRLTQFEQYEVFLGLHDPTISVGTFAHHDEEVEETPEKNRGPRVLLGIIGVLVFLLALLT